MVKPLKRTDWNNSQPYVQMQAERFNKKYSKLLKSLELTP